MTGWGSVPEIIPESAVQDFNCDAAGTTDVPLGSRPRKIATDTKIESLFVLPSSMISQLLD